MPDLSRAWRKLPVVLVKEVFEKTKALSP